LFFHDHGLVLDKKVTVMYLFRHEITTPRNASVWKQIVVEARLFLSVHPSMIRYGDQFHATAL